MTSEGVEGWGGGGSPCRMSILRNTNVASLCHLFSPMSHIEFEEGSFTCHYLNPLYHVSMAHVTLSKYIKKTAMSPCQS